MKNRGTDLPMVLPWSANAPQSLPVEWRCRHDIKVTNEAFFDFKITSYCIKIDVTFFLLKYTQEYHLIDLINIKVRFTCDRQGLTLFESMESVLL